jgi:AcrR family transcriptional regulator
VTTVTTARPRPAERAARADDFRRRLLDGLAAAIAETGYRTATVADVVRRARTSRRTFYEHFADKESCYLALLTEANLAMIRRITAAVDPQAPRETQIRQAVEAWINWAEAAPAITLSWIRDLPALGAPARQQQREAMDGLVTMIQTLGGTEQWQGLRIGPAPRELAVLLLGGLRELIATTVEDGGRIGDITETSVRACVALLAPRG